MKLSRKHRTLSALVALFGMLFMQLAVAAYACPGLEGPGDRGSVAEAHDAMESMPGCDEPDAANLSLCHAHCHDDKAAADRPDASAVAPAAVIVASLLWQVGPPEPASAPAGGLPSLLRRTTAPPLAIQLCCLRI